MAKRGSHDVRIGAAEELAAQKLARELLEHLVSGDAARARALTTRSFRWFGRAITAEEWSSGALSRFFSAPASSVSSVRAIDRGILELFTAADLESMFGGAVSSSDRIFLADITRGDRAVTVALIIARDTATGALAVDRVADPSDFKARAGALGRS